MAINFKYDDEKQLTARERLQLAQERQRNFRQEMQNSAHERFMAQHKNYVTGAMSGITSAQERGRYEREAREGALRQHEIDMLGQKGQNEQLLQKEKNQGLVDVAVQDRLAREKQAQLQLEGTKYAEDKKLEGLHDTNQTSILTKKEIADIGLKQHELEWGEGGGRERVAKIEGSSRVGAAEAQAKAVAEQNAQKNALDEQKRIAAAEKEKGRLKLQYDKLEQKDKAAVDSAANSLAKEKGISFEDARAQVMAGREQAQQNAEPQEGATKTLSSGRKVVYRGGKWQYAD